MLVLIIFFFFYPTSRTLSSGPPTTPTESLFISLPPESPLIPTILEYIKEEREKQDKESNNDRNNSTTNDSNNNTSSTSTSLRRIEDALFDKKNAGLVALIVIYPYYPSQFVFDLIQTILSLQPLQTPISQFTFSTLIRSNNPSASSSSSSGKSSNPPANLIPLLELFLSKIGPSGFGPGIVQTAVSLGRVDIVRFMLKNSIPLFDNSNKGHTSDVLLKNAIISLNMELLLLIVGDLKLKVQDPKFPFLHEIVRVSSLSLSQYFINFHIRCFLSYSPLLNQTEMRGRSRSPLYSPTIRFGYFPLRRVWYVITEFSSSSFFFV